MTRYGMLIDTTNCIGCFACRTACQRQNGQDPEVDYIRYEERETGTLPFVHHETVPLQCMHCEDPPCVHVCPTGASYIGEGGVVRVDESKCIGCRYCMAACPYQVRVHNKVSGAVEKCKFCTPGCTSIPRRRPTRASRHASPAAASSAISMIPTANCPVPSSRRTPCPSQAI